MSKAVFVLAVGMVLGLAACAGPGGMGMHADSASKTSLTSNDIDMDKVATVNRWALDRGAKLIWLNYPQKTHVADGNGGN
ncbi:MAG: hypothetical protein P4L92_05365 [Rudaea sp.]|nr:hypothetical protein [Rudaea sp.]